MARHYLAAVRARLETTYYATEAQVNYVRRLLDEAFSAGYVHGLCLDRHHLDRLTRTNASKAIDTLKAAKLNGWKA